MARPLVLPRSVAGSVLLGPAVALALPAVAQGPPDIEWQGSHAGSTAS